VNGGFKKTKS
jgi:hypothetical protein